MAIDSGEQIRADDFINGSEKDATPANDNGRVVKLEQIDGEDAKINTVFLPLNSINSTPLKIGEQMDGSTTPVAVLLRDGLIYKSEADITKRQGFIGFVSENLNGVYEPTFVNTSTSSGESLAGFQAGAGNNRVVFVLIQGWGNPHSVTSGVTYNGNAMTLVDSVQVNPAGSGGSLSWWSYPIGSNESTDTAVTITASSFSGAFSKNVSAIVYENVNQTTPFDIKAKDTATSTTSVFASNTPTRLNSKVLAGIGWGGNNFSSFIGGLTNRESPNSLSRIADVTNINGTLQSYGVNISGNSILATINFEIVPEILLTTNVQFMSPKEFPALTGGLQYYVSDTAGEISTTEGTVSIKVGKALSETQLLIIQN